jgi:hypothetical protein
MDELILEPFCTVQRWRQPVDPLQWETLIADYLQALAQQCQQAGECIVGHIKALALFTDGGYLRLSVVAPHLPASVEGAAPADHYEIDLTLNVIVYGLKREALEKITRNTAAQFAAEKKIEIN